MPLVKLISLNKKYTDEEIEIRALNDVTMEIHEGEFIAIMGPSGSGKSTLLNILGLIDTSHAGQYYFDKQEVSELTERQRTKFRKEKIGFIFQSLNLVDSLTVYENIELPLLYLKINPAERAIRIQTALEKLNIMHRKDYFPHQLSGGQQQRAAIARATIVKPKLILADEPTGNLDSVNREDVMNFLSDLNKEGTTIIIVTHLSNDARHAHRTINLFDGKITKDIKEPFIL
jgi:putative ABC transport system ATP-binding protein